MKKLLLLLPFILLASACSTQKQQVAMNPKSEFSRLKSLDGRWESKEFTDGLQERVEYRVRSGGNALEEILFPGTEHEMVSIYHLEGDSLVMTHYCMLPNQPKMKAELLDNDTLFFDFVPTPGINPARDMHIHQLKMSFVDPNTIKQEWVSYQNGKPLDSKIIEFKRLR